MINMIEWTELSAGVRSFAQTEFGRITATVLVASIAAVIWRFLQMRARVGSELPLDMARRRGNLVLAKNLLIVVALMLVASIWATKIAGAALSLAAVAGAILLVSKEFIANALGTAMLAISRPYRIGDFFQMVTTIAETLEGHQLTGRTAVLPNSLLLTQPVRNLTATGAYMVNLLNVVVDPSEDLLALEQALLRAAGEVCAPWLEEADRHLEHMESIELIDLPSSQPRVLMQFHSAKDYTLALRYTCRPNDRVKVEQEILRKYLRYRPAAIPKSLRSEDDGSVAPEPVEQPKPISAAF
jgi:small-conductance mechanosensitive channel